MMDLGSHYGKGVVSFRGLREIHGFSKEYLEQLLRPVRQSGIVESVRCAHGGYWITRPPDQITTLVIIEALEGGLNHDPGSCKSERVKSGHCAMFDLWGYRSSPCDGNSPTSPSPSLSPPRRK